MASYLPQPDGSNTCCDCPERTNPCDDCGGGTGPCCFSDGSCQILSTQDCLDAGGHPSDADNCDDPNTCLGGCCDFLSSTCSVTALDDCPAASGNTWTGYGTDCTGVNCTCCPFFTFYDTLKFSGTVTGCPEGDLTFAEQTWTKVANFPSNPGAHQFSVDHGCAFIAGTCSGTAANTFVAIDSNGDCVGNAILTADFATACGPFVLFSGVIATATCSSAVTGGSFEDLSSGTLNVVMTDGSITYNFHLSVS